MSDEKNINSFNKDVKERGRYVYTNREIFSSLLANKRQSDEIIKFVASKFLNEKKLRILDIGCGDGTYTEELFVKLEPLSITGFDNAEEAIKIANRNLSKKYKGKVNFILCSIYDGDKKFSNKNFDLAIARGVLHHLYRPEEAINKLAKMADRVLVLEPNGYNPILKIIQKTSTYHIEHEEKSYWPPELNKWFENAGYKVISQKFFSIVPFFCNEHFARFLKIIEPFFEWLPTIKIYGASTLVYYEKNKTKK